MLMRAKDAAGANVLSTPVIGQACAMDLIDEIAAAPSAAGRFIDVIVRSFQQAGGVPE
jgi:hypothetical protein